MRILIGALAVIATPATAQVVSPLSPGLSAAQADTMQTSIDAARAKADQAAAAAALACMPMAGVPPVETVAGSAGSGANCRLVNAVQPRITRAVVVTTIAGGTAVATWDALPAVPIVIPIPMIAASAVQAPSCYPVAGTITMTGATVKCFTTQSVTVALLGAVVAPITTAAAGVSVEVFAIPTTP